MGGGHQGIDRDMSGEPRGKFEETKQVGEVLYWRDLN